MKEKFNRIFQSLPPEGIAIHGTNLARAKRIVDEGFDPYKTGNVRPTWYIHQPLVIDPNDYSVSLMYIHGEVALKHARKAVQNLAYHLPEESAESKIPAVVVFIPNKTINTDQVSIMADSSIIQPGNIIGVVGVFENPTPQERKLAYLRILRLLARKKIIDFGELQQPQKE